MINDYVNDPYFVKEKYPDISVCEKCGVVFHEGIFEWLNPPPANAQKMICPACRRIADKYEGGVVYLKGSFLQKHKEEILNLIKNVEENEKFLRPLERIIEIREEKDEIVITTTYEHIARRIGEAIHKAYKGSLKLNYPEDTKYIRVYWERE